MALSGKHAAMTLVFSGARARVLVGVLGVLVATSAISTRTQESGSIDPGLYAGM